MQVLIPNALQPAEVEEVILCQMLGRAIVLVREDQLSLAIGRRGQNVRLASKLCGWDIEIMTREELDEQIEQAVAGFASLDGVERELAEKLVGEGFLSYDDLSVIEPGRLDGDGRPHRGAGRPDRRPGRGEGRRSGEGRRRAAPLATRSKTAQRSQRRRSEAAEGGERNARGRGGQTATRGRRRPTSRAGRRRRRGQPRASPRNSESADEPSGRGRALAEAAGRKPAGGLPAAPAAQRREQTACTGRAGAREWPGKRDD